MVRRSIRTDACDWCRVAPDEQKTFDSLPRVRSFEQCQGVTTWYFPLVVVLGVSGLFFGENLPVCRQDVFQNRGAALCRLPVGVLLDFFEVEKTAERLAVLALPDGDSAA